MTSYTREKCDPPFERDIATGLITSIEYLTKILPLLRPRHLTIPYVKTVVKMCSDHFDKFGCAPGREITNIFRDHYRADLNPDEKEMVARFLGSISEEYEREGFNDDFQIQRTLQYLKERELFLLNENLTAHLEGGNFAAADEAVDNFQAAKEMHVQRNLSPIYTLNDLLQARFPDCRYAVDGLIPEGFNLLSARMKFGKSHLLRNLAIDIAKGGLFLGRYKAGPGEILYLDFETPEKQAQSKLREILEAQGLMGKFPEWGHRLHHSPRGSWPRMHEGGLKKLEDFAGEHPNLIMVIIDLWGLFRPPRKSKDAFNYDQDYYDVARVKDIAERFGFSVMATHHLNKSWKSSETPFDAIYGSTGLAGAADNLFALTSSGGKANAILWGRGRYVPDFKVALEKDIEQKGWFWLGDAAKYELTQEQGAIAEALEESGKPLSPKEITLALGKGKSETNNVQQILHRMLKLGKVEKQGYGKWRLPTGSVSSQGELPLEANKTNKSSINNIANKSNKTSLKEEEANSYGLITLITPKDGIRVDWSSPEVRKKLMEVGKHYYRKILESEQEPSGA